MPAGKVRPIRSGGGARGGAVSSVWVTAKLRMASTISPDIDRRFGASEGLAPCRKGRRGLARRWFAPKVRRQQADRFHRRLEGRRCGLTRGECLGRRSAP
jgi:hypothetical protein